MVWVTFSGEMSRPRAGFYFLPKTQKNEWRNLKSAGGAYAGFVSYSWM